MPLIVEWPSAIATQAEVWRVLDLSGMTKSVRESRNFLKAGFVYLNGNITQSLRSRITLGTPFTLELRFPNGVIKTQDITVVNRPIVRKPRQTGPTVLNRRG